ncbi:MAG: DUF3800 domain-containing protein [Alphaproteobacteria bacterium]|nr:MAG: DUF3800 domain-containing protein [Alphaproteobacteria bacterium]
MTTRRRKWPWPKRAIRESPRSVRPPIRQLPRRAKARGGDLEAGDASPVLRRGEYGVRGPSKDTSFLGGDAPDYDYVLYVDEAGDLGLKTGAEGGGASSKWFCLGGVVIARKFEAELVEWVRDLRFALHLGGGPGLHYKNLPRDLRVRACDLAAGLKMRGFVVASHKENMRGHENKRAAIRNGQQPFYNFMLRVLLERVTSCVAQSSERRFGEPRRLKVVLAQTGGVYYSQTLAYIELLKIQAEGHTTYLNAMEIDPRVLSIHLVEPVSAKTVAGCQLADLVTSAFNNALNPDGTAPLFNAPAEALAPIMARRNKISGEFGVQLLPWSKQIPDEFKPIFRSYGYRWG